MNDLRGLVQQCHRDSKRWFPAVADDHVHYALSIAGEAGELANQVKKVHRGSITLDEARASIGEEAVDVLIYLLNLFAVLGVDPVDVYKEKRQKNELRFSRPGGDPRVDGARIFPDYGDPASHGYY